jgi:hypothetical protein
MHFNQRFIIAFAIAFCIIPVVTVATPNNADSGNDTGLYGFNQYLGSTPFISLLNSPPEIGPLNPWIWVFDIDSKPITYFPITEDYIYKENDTTCSNCLAVPPVSFADPLKEEQYMPAPLKIKSGPGPFKESGFIDWGYPITWP